jgi:hypothetical protein
MRRHLSYANIVATLALLFAMTGGALAAKHYIISSTQQIKPSVLKKLHGKSGRPGAKGATGETGATGPAGKEGPAGPAGNSATRLWARVAVAEETGIPTTIVASSGVAAVKHLATGQTEVIFDQDVSKCSFQATLVDYGAGYYTPPNEVTVAYTEYEPHNPAVVVNTLHNNVLANGYQFSIVALC